MKHVSLAAQPCPIARTLDIVGEWWTLLVVRDAFLGARRFEEFRATGISDNVLAARLKKLTDACILKRVLYQRKPKRYEYVLTEKGRGLAPVIVALRSWGRRWTHGDDKSALLHAACAHEITVGFYCPHCDRSVTPPEVRPERLSA